MPVSVRPRQQVRPVLPRLEGRPHPSARRHQHIPISLRLKCDPCPERVEHGDRRGEASTRIPRGPTLDHRDDPPVGLIRLGWTSKTLTPGMPITLTIHPLRDGSNGGQFLTATLPGGRQVEGGRPATTQNLLQTLRDQAAADRAVGEFLQHSDCGRLGTIARFIRVVRQV
jgi:hypothetical protein